MQNHETPVDDDHPIANLAHPFSDSLLDFVAFIMKGAGKVRDGFS